ncbi:aminoglycoside phosphotransferase family protein [Lacibacter luteus]|uniref:Aminoglycoside phosphotransferase family protein n=1 Tax=Lacibacter luteus TaxID=2508719 RepID=A0A4Q1CH33_9BACT|nr:aminoglycoside phosphotransferase family protein [Lacibacter luteus]RXK59383.1 aminoglycoside phosphotransferase family protein [Lacibacter luteus]
MRNSIYTERPSIAETVLPLFGWQQVPLSIEPFGSGLINSTWKVTAVTGEAFILQRLNMQVFTQPNHIAANIRQIADYLQQHTPGYLFAAPVQALNGTSLVTIEGTGCFRMFPFVKGSVTKDVVASAAEAYEAAVQFGQFTHLLSGFEAAQLHITIPSFHNLSLRYQQFLTALQQGNTERIEEAKEQIEQVKQLASVVQQYEAIRSNPGCKLRVTHHDTKISNVLFDEQGKGLCVIDLDTVMPGYFISDVGDMMRTYLSPVSEEESDYSKIVIRTDIFEAIVHGYFEQMKTDLSADELKLFVYAGKFMIYMQAIRFLTDYINDDVYYGARYPTHNLVRAGNQLVLLQQLLASETVLHEIVNKVCDLKQS